MNFKNWLLLNEDLDFFDKITSEKYMQMLSSDSKGQNFIQNLKNNDFRGNSALEILKDPLELYDKTTQKPVNSTSNQQYKEKFESELSPFLSDLANKKLIQIVDQKGDDFFYFQAHWLNPAVQQKAIPDELKNASKKEKFLYFANEFKNSEKKVYFSFDLTNQNSIQALKEIVNIYVEYPEYFRQAKFPTVANRSESFIFYLSKFGDDKEAQIKNMVSDVLKKLGIDLITKNKRDTGSFSGNQLEVFHLNLKLFLPLLNKNKLQNLADAIKKSFSVWKGDMSRIKETKHYALYSIIQNDPQIKQIFTNQGINIDFEERPDKTNTDKNPSETPSDKLKLISLENNKEHIVDKRDEFGQRNLTDLLPMSVKFYASSQFRLEKIQKNWIITQIIGAKNTTNLNGIPLKPSERKNLKDGDIISIGKTQQGKLQVKL